MQYIYLSFYPVFCDLIEVSVICENIAEHNNNKKLYDFLREVDRKVPDWRENKIFTLFLIILSSCSHPFSFFWQLLLFGQLVLTIQQKFSNIPFLNSFLWCFSLSWNMFVFFDKSNKLNSIWWDQSIISVVSSAWLICDPMRGHPYILYPIRGLWQPQKRQK